MRKIVILLLLGVLNKQQAYRLQQLQKSMFIDDDKDLDNDKLIANLANNLSVNGEQSENLKKQLSKQKENKQDQLIMQNQHNLKKINILFQASSDPIYGSLGPDQSDNRFNTEEEKLEFILRKKKPIQYEIDSDIKDTQENMNKAMKELHEDFEFPEELKKAFTEKDSANLADKLSTQYQVDNDVKATLESIKYAEKFYISPNGKKKVKGSKQDPFGFGKNHPRNQYAYDDEPEIWWKSLVKDQSDGMRSNDFKVKQAVEKMIKDQGIDINKLGEKEQQKLYSETYAQYYINKGNEVKQEKYLKEHPEKRKIVKPKPIKKQAKALQKKSSSISSSKAPQKQSSSISSSKAPQKQSSSISSSKAPQKKSSSISSSKSQKSKKSEKVYKESKSVQKSKQDQKVHAQQQEEATQQESTQVAQKQIDENNSDEIDSIIIDGEKVSVQKIDDLDDEIEK